MFDIVVFALDHHMRKEAIFAIIFGVLIGLVIAFGIFRVNDAMNEGSAPRKTSSDTISNPASQFSDGTLSLLKPTDRQVFGVETISVSGVSQAGSYIVITGGSVDYISEVRPDGTFEFDYEIDPFVNILTVNALSPKGERSKTELEVIYSSEASVSDEKSDISEKVENKLVEAQKKSEFFKGTVTDITESGIQIKNGGGEIKQISYTVDGTTFAKVGKTTTKLSVSDIAIGDYIYALGYKNGNGVLECYRILVSEPIAPTNINVFLGVVTKKNKADLVLSEGSEVSTNLVIDNNTKTYGGDLTDPERLRFANISEGDTIIGTYVTEKDENVARKIHILKTSELVNNKQ